MKKVFILFFATLFLSCSDSNNPGTGTISMKINGVLYEYTKISVGLERTSDMQGNQADVLYIRAEDDDNTYEHREAFVFRPYRGGNFNDQILIASRIINEGASQENGWSARQSDLTQCYFTQNDSQGFKGEFEGELKDGNDVLQITEGKIDITYGTNNYNPTPYEY